MHYYLHFYCLITYNLLHLFSLHIRWLYCYIYSWMEWNQENRCTPQLMLTTVDHCGANDHWPQPREGREHMCRYHMTSLTHTLVVHWAKLYCMHAQYPSILYTVLRWHCYSMLYFILFLMLLFLKKLFLWCINIFTLYIVQV